MNIFFILIIIFGLFINEKFNFVNHKNLKNIIKNLVIILPLITLYYNKNFLSKKYKNGYQFFKKNKKRRVTDLTKKIIASNQNWKCNLCNNILDYSYEIDHIVPLFKGGNNDNNNLQALCRNCHGRKSLNEKFF